MLMRLLLTHLGNLLEALNILDKELQTSNTAQYRRINDIASCCCLVVLIEKLLTLTCWTDPPGENPMVEDRQCVLNAVPPLHAATSRFGRSSR